jgi:hypothetical protein
VLTAFWSGLGGEFAKQWATRILSPALAFWTAGLALVWWSGHGNRVQRHGWSVELNATAAPLEQLPAAAQILLIVGALMLIAASALIVERLTLPALKLLEGYWSRPAWLRAQLVRYRRWRRRRWATTVEDLRRREARGDLSLAEFEQLERLTTSDVLTPADTELHDRLAERRQRFTAAQFAKLARGTDFLRASPPEGALGMPTRLGEVLRAAERRSFDKYGLDTVICWYRLWMLLPEGVKTEISQARLELDRAVRAWLWGALFLVWAPWLWWIAVPVGLLVPLVAYNVGMLNAAALFGDLTETAFDLHRMQLYDAMQMPRPTSPAEERASGVRLTRIFWHGESDPSIAYVTAQPPAAPDASTGGGVS